MKVGGRRRLGGQAPFRLQLSLTRTSGRRQHYDAVIFPHVGRIAVAFVRTADLR
jgi:hypothetical protein